MGCENNCVNEHRLKKIEEDFKEFRNKNSKDHKEFFIRLEIVDKFMISSKSDREHINEKLDEISGNVKVLMEKPGKRYETIATSVLTGIIGALIGFIASGVFPM